MVSSSPLLALALLLFTTGAVQSADQCAAPPPSPPGATELSLFHVSSHCSSPLLHPSTPQPEFESVQAQARHDPTRLAYLSSLVAGVPRPTTVPVASGQQATQTSGYVVRVKLGTPGQLLLVTLDTGADSAWVPCTASDGGAAFFSPIASSTYTSADCASSWCPQFTKGAPCAGPVCAYNQSYGGGGLSFSAILSQDSLRMASDIVPGYAFGCVTAVSGTGASMPKQGLLGLGRGPTSMMSQAAKYGGVFSYCLPSFRSYYFSGSLRLGPVGQPRNIRTTPLLQNPHRPSLYYVNLTGVSVGRVLVAAPPGSFAFDAETGAGTVVDSGTVISRFVGPAYAAVREEFRRQVNASGGYSSLGAFDTCFEVIGGGSVPAVTLHMEGLDLALPVENVLIHSSATAVACLAMAAAPENVNAVVNVIANLQQQNLRVMFDVANGRVGFARELCN